MKDTWISKMGIGILIFLVFFILSKFIVLIFLKIKNTEYIQKSSRELLFEFIARTIGIIIIFIGFFVSLRYIGLDLNTILVILASAGLGIALALKDFLTNCVNGIVILSLEYFKIGDLLKIDEIIGNVVDFNLITTTIVDPSNITYILPNSDIVEKSFINYSKKDIILVTATACISNSNPRVNITKILDEFSEVMRKLEYNESQNVGASVTAMDENGTTISCSYHVKPVNYFKGLKIIRLALRNYLRKKEILMCNMGSKYWLFEEES